ncbi:wings apart-like protein 2 isoform X1 [Lotus japonicus]|uniref:wings apart-like protein 2 isoform X1 n=2 Tax=Lotus japonicus TaxID=34305 RepID=UPI00258274CD|nr:wings apart-like protein 2 isoform X1 [Lotus japonicus]
MLNYIVYCYFCCIISLVNLLLSHLLGLKRNLSSRTTPFFFVELVITLVKILSDLFLRQNSSVTSNKCQRRDPFSMRSHDSDLDLLTDQKENGTVFSNSTGMYCDMERDSSMKNFKLPRKSWLSKCSQLKGSLSTAETPSNSKTFSTESCCAVASTSGSNSKTSMVDVDVLDNSRDPFAFDEDDIALSKWDQLSGNKKTSHSKRFEMTNRDFEDGCQSQTNGSQRVLNNKCSSSYISHEAGSSLLTNCLLTAVKVLMNLTNENPASCQQIAAYGGLETMPLIIAGHFPSFSSLPFSFVQIKGNTSKIPKDHQRDRHLTDFLVAILGLLVNQVEKDGHNRLRLAAATVLLPTSKGLGQAQRGVIQLLCSIFLANQSGGDGVEEDKCITLDDEAAVLQGEKEAEKMIVEAYSALLLAFLSTESKSVRKAISDNLPHHNLSTLVPVLDRFVDFHFAMNMISSETYEAVCEVIESCRVT